MKKINMVFFAIFVLLASVLILSAHIGCAQTGITLVQGPYYASNVGSLSSITVSLGSAPSQGDTVVIAFGNYGDGSQITGVTENGVSWALAASLNPSESGLQPVSIWYGYVSSSSASATITVSLNGDESNGGFAIAYEFSGISNVSPVVDQTASSYNTMTTGPQGTTATTGTTGTTSVAPELAFGTISQDQPLENSASNGFTLVTYGIGGGEYTSALYKVLTSTGTAGSTVTTSNSDYTVYTGAIVTFEGVASVYSTPTPTLTPTPTPTSSPIPTPTPTSTSTSTPTPTPTPTLTSTPTPTLTSTPTPTLTSTPTPTLPTSTLIVFSIIIVVIIGIAISLILYKHGKNVEKKRVEHVKNKA